jgi:hypothetical protein
MGMGRIEYVCVHHYSGTHNGKQKRPGRLLPWRGVATEWVAGRWDGLVD